MKGIQRRQNSTRKCFKTRLINYQHHTRSPRMHQQSLTSVRERERTWDLLTQAGIVQTGNIDTSYTDHISRNSTMKLHKITLKWHHQKKVLGRFLCSDENWLEFSATWQWQSQCWVTHVSMVALPHAELHKILLIVAIDICKWLFSVIFGLFVWIMDTCPMTFWESSLQWHYVLHTSATLVWQWH